MPFGSFQALPLGRVICEGAQDFDLLGTVRP
jgi:hypothetical protein